MFSSAKALVLRFYKMLQIPMSIASPLLQVAFPASQSLIQHSSTNLFFPALNLILTYLSLTRVSHNK